MNPWKILDLAPTTDKKQIKRAYAKKLKVTHPDDSPEAFQQLNEAYQYILDSIESVNTGEMDYQATDDAKQAPRENENDTPVAVAHKPADNISAPPIQEMINQFQHLLEQANAADWDSFFAIEALDDLEYKTTLSFNFFERLIDYIHTHNKLAIPQPHRVRLEEIFAWQEQELALCQCFDADDVGKVLTQMTPKAPVNHAKFVPPSSENELDPAQEKQPVDDLDLSASIKHLFMLFIRMVFIVVVTYYVFIKN